MQDLSYRNTVGVVTQMLLFIKGIADRIELKGGSLQIGKGGLNRLHSHTISTQTRHLAFR